METKIAKIKKELLEGIDQCKNSGGVMFDKGWGMQEGVLLTGHESEDLVSFIDNSTSQKQTIERLREFINWALNQDDIGSISGMAQFKRKGLQLLSDTETVGQKPEQKYIVGINIDDKHYLHFRTTDLGFGIYAYDSEGNRVNCLAGKIYDGDFKHGLYKNKVKIKGLLGEFKEQQSTPQNQ